jgi:hypothetical protein
MYGVWHLAIHPEMYPVTGGIKPLAITSFIVFIQFGDLCFFLLNRILIVNGSVIGNHHTFR